MHSDDEAATAFVSTIYSDSRLWTGSELIFDPEFSGGKGLSRTLGVAAFPSGAFLRAGANDGRNETWAFAEIDPASAAAPSAAAPG